MTQARDIERRNAAVERLRAAGGDVHGIMLDATAADHGFQPRQRDGSAGSAAIPNGAAKALCWTCS